MLHKDEKQSESIHNTNVLMFILRVVPVQIMAATVLNTFANTCNEASTTALIDVSFAEQIGDDGPSVKMDWT
jgi:hypothetical protein